MRYLLLPLSAFIMWLSFYIITQPAVAATMPVGSYMAFWIVWVAILLVLGVGPMLYYFIRIVILLQHMASIDKPLIIPFVAMLASSVIVLLLPLPINGDVKAANGNVDMTCYVSYWLRVIGPFLYLSAVPLAFCLRRIYLCLNEMAAPNIGRG